MVASVVFNIPLGVALVSLALGFRGPSAAAFQAHRGSLFVAATAQFDEPSPVGDVSETESISSGEAEFRDEVRAIYVERALDEFRRQVEEEESQQRDALVFAEEVQEEERQREYDAQSAVVVQAQERSQERERTLISDQERERTLT